ncbi:MAG: hypothetical protein QW136_00460 [Nitrososphaerales archaeon]
MTTAHNDIDLNKLTPGEQILLMRGKAGLFIGMPHRFIELYGGKPVSISFYPPDPMTHRENFYYNSRENQLFKKIKAGKHYTWKAIGEQ